MTIKRRIGYMAQVLPSLTMTFVYREVYALREQGIDVQTFSTWKPELNDLSSEARSLVADTFYIMPLPWARFAQSHIWGWLTRPRRMLSTLWLCLASPHASLKNRWRTSMHFLQGVYLAREMERREIAHLHAHFALNASTIAMVVARLTGITFSFTAHANDLFVNPILLPEKIKAARFIVAISEYNRAFLHSLVPTGETLQKTHVVHCGIDVERFSVRTNRPPDCHSEAHTRWGEESPADTPMDQATIVAVGRLVEKKGYPTLIEACRILADEGYRFRCLIAGSGPQEGLLRQLIDDHQLSEHVQLLGRIFQEDLLDVLAQADVFCLPCVVAGDGDMDGIPNTLMEAMAMQIATVSTTVSGIPELIEDGKTGLLAPPRDAAALAKTIVRLIKDEDLRSSLGKAARAHVADRFEIESNVHRLVELFGSFS